MRIKCGEMRQEVRGTFLASSHGDWGFAARPNKV